MKRIRIGMTILGCLLLVSCGNLGSMMSGTGVINAVSSVIGLDKVRTQDLIGTWNYSRPGCAFLSENLLAKAGGEMAAVQIEEKLLPYYQQVGISAANTTIVFNENGSFSAKIAGTPLSGSYTFDEATQQIKLKTLLLSMNCYAKRELGGISILFEADKLLTILQTMSALSGNKDMQAIGEISKNYDGVRIGFDMKK
ncbi:MAG: DUF4923 family protein [Prevotella sp.]|nr:DUF4923 family protein [Prevotella sp.]